ncbi:MAG: EAL domain-containing protein [Deltaproteobacteria bacterium]|nr:EAL domain-containing protein [Myxococcales bacterium]MDP3220102.1 EAL domain-containing protein [Deltaproteobacteria bacterium]
MPSLVPSATRRSDRPAGDTTFTPRSSGCERCERLPEPPPAAGTLFLWFPLGHSRAKAVARLRAGGHAIPFSGAGCLSVAVDEESRAGVVAALVDALTPKECADTRALLYAGDDLPGFDDISRVRSFAEFATVDRSIWLLDLLREERFTSWYQPIVAADDTSRLFGHEALLRGRAPDGSVIYPGAIFGAAADADLLFQVDLAARLSALRGAADIPADQSVFVNFSPAAIYDPVFCLQRTVRAVDELGLAHGRVVFEVVESGQAQDPAHLRRVLDFYRTQGFRVALDDVGAGFSQLNLIHLLRPDFIKVDMELIRNVHADPYKAVIVAKLLELAEGLSIPSIAEGIECVEELAWLRAHGVRYVQGYAIARPTAVPAATTPSLG